MNIVDVAANGMDGMLNGDARDRTCPPTRREIVPDTVSFTLIPSCLLASEPDIQVLNDS